MPGSQSLMRKRVLILDDHPIMRLGMAQLIDAESDMVVCGQTGTVREAMALLQQTEPDILLTDLSLPDKHGLELIKDMQTLHPACLILVLSMHDESLYAERALRAGARGYLMKATAADHLIKAIHKVLSGGIYLSEDMSGAMLQAFTRRPGSAPKVSLIQSLSDRELEVFQLIGEGLGSRQIADKLHISIRTVDAHRARIKDKLQLADATALMRHAVTWVESRGQG